MTVLVVVPSRTIRDPQAAVMVKMYAGITALINSILRTLVKGRLSL